MTAGALDPHACYRALRARDARFDGRFFIGVKTTGIYCRPVCPAGAARFENCRFFSTAAAAQSEGFRPCLRCRPETVAHLGAWRGTSNTVARALSLIADRPADIDEAGLEEVAERVGVSGRHLRRLFHQHLGATPVAVLQTRRVLFAKQLLHETRLPMSEVALASGFGSIRRFNHVFRTLLGRPPGDLRREVGEVTATSGVTVRLRYRPPYDWEAMLAYLEARAIDGLERITRGPRNERGHGAPRSDLRSTRGEAGCAERTSGDGRGAPGSDLRSTQPGPTVAELERVIARGRGPHTRHTEGGESPRARALGPRLPRGHQDSRGASPGGADALAAGAANLPDRASYERLLLRGGKPVVVHVRHELEAACLAVTFHGADVHALGPLVAKVRGVFDLDADVAAIGAHLSRDPLLSPLVRRRAGLRLPGAWDGFESAVRTVLGQQVTVEAGRKLASRLVALCGGTHFPTPREVERAALEKLRIPRARQDTLRALARAASRDPHLFDAGASLEATVERLCAIRGVGAWTAHVIALRAAREPDAFPVSDAVLLRAAAAQGGPAGAGPLLARAEAWRPWRGYAAQHLWASERTKQEER